MTININDAVETRSIKIRGKNRQITKYADNTAGYSLQIIHKSMNKAFRGYYSPSRNSFAYLEGRSILMCLEPHIKSTSFIKLDIHQFFNSISKDIIVRKLLDYFGIDDSYRSVSGQIVSSCFYMNHLPLGLVLSPILSDLVLNCFDSIIDKYCTMHNLYYTRYADDIMISSRNSINEEKRNEILHLVIEQLQKESLSLNEQKTLFVNFDDCHTFIRFLGVNIVKGEAGNKNYISVGRSYIYNLAKTFIEYQKLLESVKEPMAMENEQVLNEQIYYLRAEIIGKIGFIKQIEGSRGVERLKSRLWKYYPDIDVERL